MKYERRGACSLIFNIFRITQRDDSQCLCIYYIKEKIYSSIKLYSNDSAFYSDSTHIFRFLMRCVIRKILKIKEHAPRRSYFKYFRRTAFFNDMLLSSDFPHLSQLSNRMEIDTNEKRRNSSFRSYKFHGEVSDKENF
jgi:hypothetical protein